MSKKGLSEDQMEAVEAVKSWYQSDIKKPFRINGVAGCGKSTVTASLVDELDTGIVFMAPTGKAASVLRSKGVSAATIHSTIYESKADMDLKKVIYHLRDKFSFNNSLFVVDEASMVDEELRRDIEYIGKKVIYVGDSFQLPPVGSSSNHMELSNFSLTKLHRFAENNPIYTLSHHIRNGGDMRYGIWGKGVERRVKGALIKPGVLSKYDIVLCGYNTTRTMINNMLRKYYGYKGILNPGERVIVSKNNKDKEVANGDMGTIVSVGKETKDVYLIDVEILMDGTVNSVNMLLDTHNLYGIDLAKEAKYSKYKFAMTLEKNRVFMDYGYCLTVHKSQGSEYDNVLLIEEPIGDTIEDKRKWLYTAVTRAKRSLMIGA